jgi:methylenetetrahydrofolate dehydrogenase (NADP+)/methenyltetrahydrofolate cyclohydrolase
MIYESPLRIAYHKPPNIYIAPRLLFFGPPGIFGGVCRDVRTKGDPMGILDGKKLAQTIRQETAERVTDFAERFGRPPGLSVVLVGDDPASQIYVRNKARACKNTGIKSMEYKLPFDTSEAALLELLARLNRDGAVDGILVQLPVPGHIRSEAVIEAIDPKKDVDGLHPTNIGALVAGKKALRSCTPHGCMRLIDEAGINLEGLNAVVVGRSTMVGKPMAMMLLERNATVTMCHSRTHKLAHIIQEADVVVAAAGVPEMIKGDWIKRGATVIDVGINRLEDGRIVGDVEFETAAAHAAWITPVPGGVGPMTIACLVSNTVDAAEIRMGAI